MKRCKFSQEGLEALTPRRPDRMGTMVSESAIYRRVRWDGLKSITTYAKQFIEPLDEQHIDMRGLLSDAAE